MPSLNTVQAVLASFPRGQFFAVDFIKRTNGEARTMQCRTGVKRHLKGGELNYNPNEKGLVVVWSPQAAGQRGAKDAGYRTIPVEGVTQIRANGQVFDF